MRFIVIGMVIGFGGWYFSACRGKVETGSHQQGHVQRYYCSMHPSYISDKPGDCPICGMKLIPLDENNQAPKDISKLGKTEGLAVVTLSADKQQMIGVKTEPVQKRLLTSVILASGKVAYDPELYSTIIEYQTTVKSQSEAAKSPLADVKEQNERLLRATVSRLKQMGLSDAQVDQLNHPSEKPESLLLSQKGDAAWIYAQVYQYESGLIQPGQKMEIISTAFPGKTLVGKVNSIDNIVNPETRSLRVRGEVPNTEGLLRPEMYVDVKIIASLGVQLAVPDSAVLDSGTRKIVFVESGESRYEPREIRIGHEADNYYAVVSGLKEGEKVVTAANFLIDSESKLNAAFSKKNAD